MGYTKLFTEIIMSTIWREKNHVRLLWITMLAMKDRWHIVDASLPGLADAARITMDECVEALGVLSSPDKYSRTTEHEGRRIEACDGGWLILNGEKYRNKMSLDERREYQRIKQAEYRKRKKSVKSCLQSSQQFTHTDTDTKADTKEKIITASKINTFKKPTVREIFAYCQERANKIDPERFFDHYESNGWMVGKTAMKNWKAAVRTWEKSNIGAGNGKNKQDNRSRAKRVSDKLDEIAQKDIEENGYTEFMD